MATETDVFYLYHRNERIQIKICYFADAKKRPSTVAPMTDEMHPAKLSQTKHLINKFLGNSGIRSQPTSAVTAAKTKAPHVFVMSID